MQNLSPSADIKLKAIILCEHKKFFYPTEFQVVHGLPNVLGLKSSTELNIIKRIESIKSQYTSDPMNDFADVFTGLGCINNAVHHIKIDSSAKPVVYPPRRVPITLRPKVKAELQ